MRYDTELPHSVDRDVHFKETEDVRRARQFYEHYWNSLINSNIGRFRGDTIFSFNTIAGCMIRLFSTYDIRFHMPNDRKERLNLILESDEVCDELKKKFETFYNHFNSLANCMPFIMPSEYCDDPRAIDLHNVRAHDYHKYPDLFLSDVRRYYDKTYPAGVLMQDANRDYFSFFKRRGDGWKHYVEDNYLQDFFLDQTYTEFIKIAPDESVKMPYNLQIARSLSSDDIKQCTDAIDHYLTQASAIIERRAKRFNSVK